LKLLKLIKKILIKDVNEISLKYAEQIVLHLKEKPSRYHVGIVNVGGNGQALTNAIKTIQDKLPHVAVLLLSPDPEHKTKKVVIVAAVPKDLTSKLKASEWAKDASSICGGKGGGKDDTAQGSGTDDSKIKLAETTAEKFAASRLN